MCIAFAYGMLKYNLGQRFYRWHIGAISKACTDCFSMPQFGKKFQSLIARARKLLLQLHADLSVNPKFWGHQVFIYSGYCSCY